MLKKVCRKCWHPKPLKDFSPAPRYMYGVSSWCKNCLCERQKLRYRDNAAGCRDKSNARNRTAGKQAVNKVYRLNNRNTVLALYGDACECCGETRREFLAIDHKNGGGSQHRKTVSSEKLYRILSKLEVPDPAYRLLCHNCNMARGYYGYCPHERENEQTVFHCEGADSARVCAGLLEGQNEG